MELLEQWVKRDFQTDFSLFSTLNVKENGLMFFKHLGEINAYAYCTWKSHAATAIKRKIGRRHNVNISLVQLLPKLISLFLFKSLI